MSIHSFIPPFLTSPTNMSWTSWTTIHTPSLLTNFKKKFILGQKKIHHSYCFKLFIFVCFVESFDLLSQAPISWYGFCSSLVIKSHYLQTRIAMITNFDLFYVLLQGFTNCVFRNCVITLIFFLGCFVKFQQIELQGNFKLCEAPNSSCTFCYYISQLQLF